MAQVTRDLLKQIRIEGNEALRAVAEKHGITLTLGNGSYDPDGTSGSLKLNLEGTAEDGKGAAEKAWEVWAPLMHLDGVKLGDTFKASGRTFTITGVQPSRHKYPINATNENGRGFKFTEQTVRSALGLTVRYAAPTFGESAVLTFGE
jgi:hypothetical protein